MTIADVPPGQAFSHDGNLYVVLPGYSGKDDTVPVRMLATGSIDGLLWHCEPADEDWLYPTTIVHTARFFVEASGRVTTLAIR